MASLPDVLSLAIPSAMRDRLESEARARCLDADPAHDFAHVARVVANAARLARAEHARIEVTVVAALLHELFNYPKNHPESSRSGEVCAGHATALLRECGADEALVEPVAYAIRVHPFSRGIVPTTLEARVLQDADRLDALGAIGIARCFATCAQMRRPLYAPDDPLCTAREPDDRQWGVDHFYRKLLGLGATMHTGTARAMAHERTAFMQAYLAQLGREISMASAPEAHAR